MHGDVIVSTTLAPIPLVDVQAQNESLRAELDDAVRSVVSRAQFIGGPAVEAFTEAFAAFCGVKHAVGCANGTEALRLAILGVLGPGDGCAEIITVSHTFAATAEAIVMAGYTPVFVDVDPKTYLMDLDQLADACGPITAAVIPVHLYGQMVDMGRLVAWADGRGLAVIEDAAQAHGARFGGVAPGQLSQAASFSFYPGKNLGAWGDAGAVVCNDVRIAERIAQLADHGRSDKFTHTWVGSNARMDAIQAAVLRVKLGRLDGWNAARRRVAGWYDDLLRSRCDILLPRTAYAPEHVFHLFTVQLTERDAVRKSLSEQGIATGIHYPIPVHDQPAYRKFATGRDALPVTSALCKRILSLPIYPELTRTQAERVAAAVISAAAKTVATALA